MGIIKGMKRLKRLKRLASDSGPMAAIRGATLVAVLVAAACSGGDGSLGTVEVPAGEAVQIRSLNTITGDVAYLGIPNQRGVELAVADFGPVRGFDVDLGTRYDDLCSSDGAQAAAQTIVADEDVVGVIGPSCSTAAVAAAPLITAAQMVLIAPSNTSPTLTSDLTGNPGLNHSVGYYRTSNNGLFVGETMARFVHEGLGFASAAVIHDGDPYSRSIAQAFADHLERLGGTVTGFSAINKEDTDMVPVLTEVATGNPDALFFPIFQPAGDFLTDQAPGVPGLEDTTLLTDAALLNDGFMSLPQSAGVYFSGARPAVRRHVQSEHRQDPRQPAGRLRRDLRRAALGAVLGPRLRRGDPAARSDSGRLQGGGRHSGHRPGRRQAIPERSERVQRHNRDHQL